MLGNWVLSSSYVDERWDEFPREQRRGGKGTKGSDVKTKVRTHSQSQNRPGSEAVVRDRVEPVVNQDKKQKAIAKDQTRTGGQELGQGLAKGLIKSWSQSQKLEAENQQGSACRSRESCLCFQNEIQVGLSF